MWITAGKTKCNLKGFLVKIKKEFSEGEYLRSCQENCNKWKRTDF